MSAIDFVHHPGLGRVPVRTVRCPACKGQVWSTETRCDDCGYVFTCPKCRDQAVYPYQRVCDDCRDGA